MESPAGQIEPGGARLMAYTESRESRTSVVDGGTEVFWDTEDEIKVFSGESSGKFVSLNSELALSAEFAGPSGFSFKSGEDIAAVYPYSEDATWDGEAFTVTLPSEQVACPGTFAKGMNIAVAKSKDSHALQFRNVGGGVRFSVKEEGVKKVIFEGLDGEAIAGKVKIGFEDGIPVVREVTDGRLFITLTAPDGASFEVGKWYYIVAIPGALDKGFKLRFYKEDTYAKRISDNPVSIKRSVFGSIAEVDRGEEYEPMALHFPKTEDEIIESVERTQNVCKAVNGIISDFLEVNGADSDELLSRIEEVDDVLTAVINEDHSTVSVMQRDSVWVNYFLFRDNPPLAMDHEKPDLQSLQVYVNKTKSSRENELTKSAENGIEISSKKALILAPFATGANANYTDFDAIYSYLQDAGISKDNIHCYKDRQVTLNHFRGDYLDDYDIIIIKTHGCVGYTACNSQGVLYENHCTTTLATSVPFSLEQVQSLYNAGVLKMDEIALVSVGEGENSEPVLAVTPSFLDGASFDDACVILGACESAKIESDSQFGYGTSMIEAFQRKGAGFVAGFSENINSYIDYAITTLFLELISDGVSAQKAAEYWINSKDLELLCSSYKDSYFKYALLMQKPFNGSGYSQSLFRYYPSTGDYYLVDKCPKLEEPIIGDDGITLSWSSDLFDISEVIPEFGEIKSYNENGITDCDIIDHTKEFKVHYDVYYDGFGCAERRLDHFPDKSLVERIPLLSPGEHTWYVEAFIMDGNTVIDSFQSEEGRFIIKSGGYAPEGAVDMGLSVYWASCNIGASKPEEYGRYFGWGDITGQTWDGQSGSGGGFYDTPEYAVDSKGNLKPEYDAAHVILGGNWRMPTMEECQELIDNTTNIWTSINGVNGIRFQSKINGNSVFMPAGGQFCYGSVEYHYSYYNGEGYYRNSTIDRQLDNYGGDLFFRSGVVWTGFSASLWGELVRPVWD